jgi:Tfp pilus assembly protein FimT
MTELLVVMAIVGIIMALSVPAIWTYFRAATMRAGAEELVTALNGARELAIRSNTVVCVTNNNVTMQYRLGNCNTGTIWTSPGTDAAGNVALANNLRVSSEQPTLCYSYLGAGSNTPANCFSQNVFTVTNPANGATMTVQVAATGRARIQ